MSTLKILLVATDFSVAAETALDFALPLAATLGAKVYLLHAYQLPPQSVFVTTAQIALGVTALAEKELADCVAKRKESSVQIVPMLKQADAREAILEAAEEVSADLVIMGTHGRRGIARALIGSVAEAVVRASPVPVLTVHAAVP